MKSHYKVIRKSENKRQQIMETGPFASDIGSAATTNVVDYHKQEIRPYNLIYYVREGELSLTIEGQVIVLKEGDACIIDKNTEYEVRGTASFMLMKKPRFGSLF